MKKLTLLFAFLFLASLARAQSFDTTFELGAGAIFTEEEDTFDTDAARASLQVAGVELPFIDAGLVFEAGYSSGFIYELWEANETMVGNVITGLHLRVYKGGPLVDDGLDFDTRVVGGYRFTENLAGRIYFLEDDRPIAFNVAWRF